MQITRGIIQSAQKVVIYGPEGIGKSTFASYFPNPVFIDTEGSTKHMDVARLPKPSSWAMLLDDVKYIKANPSTCGSLIIDTADWSEMLCVIEVCARAKKSSIEDFGYGKGYTYLEEEFGRLLNALEEIVELGINVVFTAHAQMRKFEQPDEMGAYDRWEMKLEKKTAPLLKEWADLVLFANYKTLVINVDNQGAQKGKNKAQGGSRVMYTTHHPCWDAKNRHGLQEELKFEYSEIAHCIPGMTVKSQASAPQQQSIQIEKQTEPVGATPVPEQAKQENKPTQESTKSTPAHEDISGVPKPLADLMLQNSVTIAEIQKAVASRGYYPENTPVQNYDAGFVSGVLIGAWPQVYKMIIENRPLNDEQLPF